MADISDPERKKDKRIIVLIFLLIGVVVYAFTVAVRPRPPESGRSPEFLAQTQVAVDAIRRFTNASGSVANIAKLEMEREADALDRLAKNQFEDNTVLVIRSCVFRATMMRIKPDKETIRVYVEACRDAENAGY